MISPREGSPRRRRGGRMALWAGLAVGGMIPSIGCQVEYAGMTLPSGKYMHDDVQYFAPGPDFPWANTQAATQRARLSVTGEAYGLPPMPAAPGVGPIVSPPPAPGALPGVQNIPFRATDVNVSPLQPVPQPNAPGEVPAPGAPPPEGGPTAPDLGPR
jgi:hypothetical protein